MTWQASDINGELLYDPDYLSIAIPTGNSAQNDRIEISLDCSSHIFSDYSAGGVDQLGWTKEKSWGYELVQYRSNRKIPRVLFSPENGYTKPRGYPFLIVCDEDPTVKSGWCYVDYRVDEKLYIQYRYQSERNLQHWKQIDDIVRRTIAGEIMP